MCRTPLYMSYYSILCSRVSSEGDMHVCKKVGSGCAIVLSIAVTISTVIAVITVFV